MTAAGGYIPSTVFVFFEHGNKSKLNRSFDGKKKEYTVENTKTNSILLRGGG